MATNQTPAFQTGWALSAYEWAVRAIDYRRNPEFYAGGRAGGSFMAEGDTGLNVFQWPEPGVELPVDDEPDADADADADVIASILAAPEADLTGLTAAEVSYVLHTPAEGRAQYADLLRSYHAQQAAGEPPPDTA